MADEHAAAHGLGEFAVEGVVGDRREIGEGRGDAVAAAPEVTRRLRRAPVRSPAKSWEPP